MAIMIAREDPRQPDMESLLAELNAYLSERSPPEFCHQLTIDQMVGDDIFVFVARNGQGEAIGCGALRLLPADWGPAWGEVKRMYVRPDAQGTGVGRKLLEQIEQTAIANKLCKLVLETGIAETHQGAHRLYVAAGFRERDAFGDYPPSDWNIFMEKPLSSASSPSAAGDA